MNVIPSQTSPSDLPHTSPTPISTSSSPIPSPLLSNGQSLTNSYTTFTTSYPVVISQSSTTFTSYVTSIVTTSTSIPVTQTPLPQSNLGVNFVCIGQGIDSVSIGLLAVAILSALVGFIIWLIFAVVRPKFREIYGIREWFPQQGLRPRPLGDGFFAFLSPEVPLVPDLPEDVQDAGRNVAIDARLFPSDEELTQRALWIALLICMGWSILALGGAIPLYLINVPCMARSAPQTYTYGGYSAVYDLSLLRLLQLLDDRKITTTTDVRFANSTRLATRAIVDGNDLKGNARLRIIILTALLIALGLIPALWKILREFNTVANYRKRWMKVKCANNEMGWLPASRAPGFVGWGEKRLKSYLLKAGLSSRLESAGESRREKKERERRLMERNNSGEGPEVDIESLFSIGDTEHLAFLIDERDDILDHLEMAETRYIASFRTSTPDPSIVDFEFQPTGMSSGVPARPQISRPMPLSGSHGVARPRPRPSGRRQRNRNPAYASSSLPPTSYLMPSSYYKIRNVEGVSGGHFTDPEDSQPRQGRSRGLSFTDTITQRVVGSRFQEVNRDSTAYGRLPIGSPVHVDETGQFVPPPSSAVQTPILQGFGPNYDPSSSETYESGHHDSFFRRSEGPSRVTSELGEDWVDVLYDPPQKFGDEPDYDNPTGADPDIPSFPPLRPRRRPQRPIAPPSDHRETFPLRIKRGRQNDNDPLPPHLRLQQRQPFVRPMSGLDHQDLGVVYGDISNWRTRLKAINAEIADAQRDGYNDIADGARIKGWLMVGKGLRFLPGIELIDGRSKEDIRWDELQHHGSAGNRTVYWILVAFLLVLLAAGLSAVAGLLLATSPDVAEFLPFFRNLRTWNKIPSGIVTVLIPTIAATSFIAAVVLVIRHIARFSGHISVSGSQMTAFRTTFIVLTVMAGAWLTAIGAVLYSVNAFQHGGASKTVADGSILMTVLALALIINVAIIVPGLLMLQPFRLWRVVRNERRAITPRQRFRAVYPGVYDPVYAISCCILAVIFASAFALILPLVAPAVTLLLFLTLIAHRFLVGYVYGRTKSPTGGLVQLFMLRGFALLLTLQPLVLGLILLSRRLWPEGGTLIGTSVAVAIFVELFCSLKTREPGVRSLSPVTRNSLDTFRTAARPARRRNVDEESVSLVSSEKNTRSRGSMASVLEMMSITLAVIPSPSQARGPVPLQTETLDDLTATDRAARTHPEAPPHIPPLPFTDHAEDMAGILYAPELIAPPPIIWLPNDTAGIAMQEAYDLQQYHSLPVTLDVKSQHDVMPRRAGSSRSRGSTSSR
ncbi:hypothetical protein BDM02DRAFT_3090164 [Thelephora ganbajun]|uniref:Uncharacterized protein n=1 Tax=Thelephora ganbajun TaxID=370292 RepID=A0ACB6ZQZ8_THEGA|nr:hypothetical protein BDM02DRAFT_3090164 [Thelephora ganbajun]